MSVKLSAEEKIVRKYDYGTTKTKGAGQSSTASKSLIVTNKRIIHQIVSLGTKSETINVNEMPISSASYINTYYKNTSSPLYLIFGIIFFILGIVLITMNPSTGAPAIFLGIIFFVFFFMSKSSILVCDISTNTVINSAMSFSTDSSNTNTAGVFARLRNNRKKAIKIKVSVKSDIAKKIATELGAVIMDAANGKCVSEE